MKVGYVNIETGGYPSYFKDIICEMAQTYHFPNYVLEVTLGGLSFRIVEDIKEACDVAIKDNAILFGCPIDRRERRKVTLYVVEPSGQHVQYHTTTWRNKNIKGTNHK